MQYVVNSFPNYFMSLMIAIAKEVESASAGTSSTMLGKATSMTRVLSVLICYSLHYFIHNIYALQTTYSTTTCHMAMATTPISIPLPPSSPACSHSFCKTGPYSAHAGSLPTPACSWTCVSWRSTPLQPNTHHCLYLQADHAGPSEDGGEGGLRVCPPYPSMSLLTSSLQ